MFTLSIIGICAGAGLVITIVLLRVLRRRSSTPELGSVSRDWVVAHRSPPD